MTDDSADRLLRYHLERDARTERRRRRRLRAFVTVIVAALVVIVAAVCSRANLMVAS